MKKLILFALIALLGVSCADEWFDSVVQSEQLEVEELEFCSYPKRNASISRSGTDGVGFWEEWDFVVLNSGDTVTVPWARQGVTTSAPSDIRMDIKARDGWELIFLTVNNSDIRDPGTNYLVFHNKYTGMLKGFYYAENPGLQNTAIWHLHFEFPQSFLAFSNEFAGYSTDKTVRDIYLGNLTVDNGPTGFYKGWNCFQTELAYDPDLNIAGTLFINPYNVSSTNIKLEGDFESTTDGAIISTTTSNGTKEPIKNAAKYAGKQAEEWVSEAIENGGIFKKIGSLVVKGAGSLVSSGISSLLGSFTGGFDKENKTVQAVDLKTSGTITVSGELTEHLNGSINPCTISLDVKDVGHLGAWSLSGVPTLLMDPYATHHEVREDDPYIHIYRFGGPYVDLEGLQKVLNINPDLLTQIKDYDIHMDIYESSEYSTDDAFEVGLGAVRNPYYYYDNPSQHLYNHFSTPVTDQYVGVVFRNHFEDTIVSEKDAPFEIYIPETPKGEKGAIPKLTVRSNHVLAVSLHFKVNDNNTVVSSHTFTPKFRWDYYKANDWYLNVYPFLPLGEELDTIRTSNRKVNYSTSGIITNVKY